MFNLKTHFEQVPLDIVRKIVEAQILWETTAGQHELIKQEKSKNALSEADEQRIVRSLAFAQLE